MMEVPNTSELIRKYKEKLEEELDVKIEKPLVRQVESSQYKQFREEMLPAHYSFFEKMCVYAGSKMKVKVAPDKEAEINADLETAHMNIKAQDVYALSFLLPILVMFLGAMIPVFGFILEMIFKNPANEIFFKNLFTDSIFFAFITFIIGLILIPVLLKIPSFIATSWRMKASNQMILSVFYVVTYMRHTSNLELAIGFAAEHLSPPLSLDFKKVLWDIENSTYPSIRESLDAYLDTWKKYNNEFIESFHLIESSLYETSEERRIQLLDKSLDVILTETYEKMLHYAHNLKSPITTLHMMGVILPILGLVMLPLVVSFMSEVKWYYIATFYNILLPIGVFYLAKVILNTRPTGYGDVDITELNPELKKYKKVDIHVFGKEFLLSPGMIGIIIGVSCFILGLSPLFIHAAFPAFDYNLTISNELKFPLLDYRRSIIEADQGMIIGPYGIGAAIISLLFPLGLGLSLGYYYKLRSQHVMKIRENSKKLETEFANALFQLGNRLGDGIPAEAAVGRVADNMEDTTSGQFFRVVSNNIKKLGMGLKDAIFNPRSGALIYFPSAIIESSMKVLIESIKKGPSIAAQSLSNIARYIKEIHTVDERLKDLMADIISDVKSQINMLAPAMSAIVMGITSMITTIIGALSSQVGKLSESASGATRVSDIISMFGNGIPTYFFQILVGVYVVEIIYILTVMASGIENGADKLGEEYELGNNLIRSTLIYCALALTVIILFNVIAGSIIGKVRV